MMRITEANASLSMQSSKWRNRVSTHHVQTMHSLCNEVGELSHACYILLPVAHAALVEHFIVIRPRLLTRTAGQVRYFGQQPVAPLHLTRTLQIHGERPQPMVGCAAVPNVPGKPLAAPFANCREACPGFLHKQCLSRLSLRPHPSGLCRQNRCICP
jgi:hypothetical protein